MLRRTLLVISLLALLVVCIKPRMLQIVFLDREASAREMNGSPDRLWPLYPRFLEGVRAHTQPGDTIAIIAPGMAWDNGYSYAYYRASYFLTGREVLPLVTPENEKLPQNFRAARYLAAFGMTVRMPAEIVWQGEGGILLRPVWGAAPPAGRPNPSAANATTLHPESQR
jgi:hypothetical protein